MNISLEVIITSVEWIRNSDNWAKKQLLASIRWAFRSACAMAEV